MRPFSPSNFAAGLIAALALAAPVSLAAQDDGGPVEGIHVRGDWVIEVRNPDGSVAERREFTNDLVSPQSLAWAISVAGSASIAAIRLTNCYEDAGAAVPCFLGVTTNQDGQESQATAGTNPVSLVLEGSLTTSLPTVGTTTVTDVATIAAVCPGNTECTAVVSSPLQVDSSIGATELALTSTTLATPVDLADGQTVVVTVTITFN